MRFPLVSNDRVASSVTAFLKEDRLPHAILIEGDPGTGKHTLARYLSAAAVCTGKERPCGECRACKQAIAFSHPDVRVTAPEDGKKLVSVGQIRDLREEAYIKPFSAPRRVFLIDKADTMNDQAQNALLKVLEEPPGPALFLLLAESASALLSTVRSRCTLLSLAPPEREVSLAFLRETCQKPEAELQTALDEASGNLGKAIGLLNGEASDSFTRTAEQFLSHFIKGEELQMLTVLAPFSSKRAETDRLFKALKLACCAHMRAAVSSPNTAGRFSKLYDVLTDCETALVTNINLNLLFCSLVSKAASIYLD